MNPKDFVKAAQKITIYVGREAPQVIGQLIVNDIKENFNKESYQGKPWKKLKQKTVEAKTKKNGSVSKTLVDKGNLAGSIDYNADFNQVSVGAMNERTGEYAGVHNEGLRSGRGAGFTMPQRQFMPIPDQPLPQDLLDAINTQLENDLNEIFNQ